MLVAKRVTIVNLETIGATSYYGAIPLLSWGCQVVQENRSWHGRCFAWGSCCICPKRSRAILEKQSSHVTLPFLFLYWLLPVLIMNATVMDSLCQNGDGSLFPWLFWLSSSHRCEVWEDGKQKQSENCGWIIDRCLNHRKRPPHHHP